MAKLMCSPARKSSWATVEAEHGDKDGYLVDGLDHEFDFTIQLAMITIRTDFRIFQRV